MKTRMQKQRGATLVMILAVTTGLLMSAGALYRSAEVNSLIAGNVVTKSTSTLLSDMGIMLAVEELDKIKDLEVDSDEYYALQQSQDKYGLPTTVDWKTVGNHQVDNYNIQYVLERLCSGALPVENYGTQCTMQADMEGTSHKAGTTVVSNDTAYYRATIKVTGPKDAVTYFQAILQK